MHNMNIERHERLLLLYDFQSKYKVILNYYYDFEWAESLVSMIEKLLCLGIYFQNEFVLLKFKFLYFS